MYPCPFLPQEVRERPWRHGDGRGEGFYLDALEFAQGYWVDGKPGQSILQLNRAFSARLPVGAQVLEQWPLPYLALEWILERAMGREGIFLGNPVRHFQHLATRIRGVDEHAALRKRRAWACFWLARKVLVPAGDFPMDGRQLAREGIWVPREETWQG